MAVAVHQVVSNLQGCAAILLLRLLLPPHLLLLLPPDVSEEVSMLSCC
jgi:hypothetical protein